MGSPPHIMDLAVYLDFSDLYVDEVLDASASLKKLCTKLATAKDTLETTETILVAFPTITSKMIRRIKDLLGSRGMKAEVLGTDHSDSDRRLV